MLMIDGVYFRVNDSLEAVRACQASEFKYKNYKMIQAVTVIFEGNN